MHRNGYRRALAPLAATGVGVLLMYLLDPQQGPRRVALVRDRLDHWAHLGRATTGTGLRDLRHRAEGTLAELRGAVRREPVDDVVLAERVRAALGRWVSHPRAIEVSVADGEVRLKGHVLLSEHDGVLRGVCSVRGVRAVDDGGLELHLSQDRVPMLQGGPRRNPAPMQRHWPPGPRLLALAAGTALAAWCMTGRRPAWSSTLLALGGIGLAARAAGEPTHGRSTPSQRVG